MRRSCFAAFVASSALLGCGSSGSSQKCLATILPTEVTVAAGDAVTFTSSLDGRARGTVSWTATAGVVDSVGNWQAPDKPAEAVVTVTDTTISGCSASARAHVVASDGGASDAGTDAGN